MTLSFRGLLISLTAVLVACALAVPSARASPQQISIVLDDLALNANPQQTLDKLHAMGVTMVKYAVYWNEYAPDATSTTAPSAATDPSAYNSFDQFGLIDEIDEDATALGMKVGLEVTAPAPRWAEGTSGCLATNIANGACRPSASDYETFIRALGTRYSGHFSAGASNLPAITWWSVWNEPNYIPNIAPQRVGATTYESADLYRGLVNAAWAGLEATGHGADTFIFGELAPRGISGSQAGNGAGVKPVQFLASLYCVTTSGRRLSGAVAAANDCPSGAAAFRHDNPALFGATGVADHPYSQGTAPDVKTYDCRIGGVPLFCENGRDSPRDDPLWTDLASISNLENGLATDLRAYGSSRQFSIWNTEFGYWASPPGRQACRGATPSDCDLPPATAARYENWAEYISYANPRIASFAQYQLHEPAVGNWVDGLLARNGTPEPAYAAFEVPLFMPRTVTRSAGALTVWGDVRAAAVLQASSAFAPTVEIQFKARAGSWRTLKTVTVSNPRGYFSTSVSFGQSGSVRLVSPQGATAQISRVQAITVR
jgi:hypothetical protein